MNKPRVLFIMHMPPPMHGAAQMGLYIHDSKLINESFECRYINPSASKNVKDVGRISMGKFRFLFSLLNEIYVTINDWHPDLVYITPSSWDWGFYRDYITVLLLKSNNCRIVAHFHNRGVISFENKWYNKMLYRSFFKGISTIFLSKRLVPEFEEYINLEKMYICPNGIKSNVKITQRELNLSKPFEIMFLSNMMEEKGVFVLLEACKELVDMGADFKCVFIGKWADVTEDVFLKKVEKFGLKDFVYAHGAKYGAEKRPYFETTELLVFPTFYHGETFGLVLLEAMDFSLPVIGTDIGGIPDIIEDGKTGFVIPSKDSKSLSDKIFFLIKHRDVAYQMGLAGRRIYLEKYTYEIFEKNVYNILCNCLK